MRLSCLLLLLICLLSPAAWPQEDASRPGFRGLERAASPAEEVSEETDESALARLRQLANKLHLTEAEEELSARLVERLGRRPVRRRVARLLNRNGGRLDRSINKVLIKRAWKHHGPLPNLAEVAPGVLRGGQPTEAGFTTLRERGVSTVVNLRLEDNGERALVERLGMRAVWMPIPDTGAPTREQALEFLALTAAAAPGDAVFFHCAAGSFRTSTMAALYRIEHGGEVEAALREAESYGWMEEWLDADLEAEFVREWADSSSAEPRAQKRTSPADAASPTSRLPEAPPRSELDAR